MIPRSTAEPRTGKISDLDQRRLAHFAEYYRSKKQDELSTLNKFSWLEPTADSFNLQMNMLGLSQHTLMMKQGTGSPQVYNLTLERQRAIAGSQITTREKYISHRIHHCRNMTIAMHRFNHVRSRPGVEVFPTPDR